MDRKAAQGSTVLITPTHSSSKSTSNAGEEKTKKKKQKQKGSNLQLSVEDISSSNVKLFSSSMGKKCKTAKNKDADDHVGERDEMGNDPDEDIGERSAAIEEESMVKSDLSVAANRKKHSITVKVCWFTWHPPFMLLTCLKSSPLSNTCCSVLTFLLLFLLLYLFSF